MALDLEGVSVYSVSADSSVQICQDLKAYLEKIYDPNSSQEERIKYNQVACQVFQHCFLSAVRV